MYILLLTAPLRRRCIIYILIILGHSLSNELDDENRNCLHAAACGG